MIFTLYFGFLFFTAILPTSDIAMTPIYVFGCKLIDILSDPAFIFSIGEL